MSEVDEFLDKRGQRRAEEQRYNANAQLITHCQILSTKCIRAMREQGADNKWMIRILKHAVRELERGEPTALIGRQRFHPASQIRRTGPQ